MAINYNVEQQEIVHTEGDGPPDFQWDGVNFLGHARAAFWAPDGREFACLPGNVDDKGDRSNKDHKGWSKRDTQDGEWRTVKCPWPGMAAYSTG